MKIDIRPPQNAEEVRHIEDIQAAAWGMDDRALAPYNVLHAWMHADGIVLCAFDGARMVGFAAGFMGRRGGKLVHWSHMAAVIPAYRRRGIGRMIKLAQRDYALKQGLDTMAWTYDPMRKENAIFNIEVLGVDCRILHYELYGEMTDGINRGLLSDRFEVEWDLKSERVAALASGERAPFMDSAQPENYVLRMTNQEPDATQKAAFDHVEYGIELPGDLNALREISPALTHRWYHALRDAVTPLFEAGYTVSRIYLDDQKPDAFTYVLARDAAWYLYILETADGSLYTGITTELERRVDMHNAGRGAKYTASRRPVKLLAAWETFGQSQATRFERRLKRTSRGKKRALIDSGADFDIARRVI